MTTISLPLRNDEASIPGLVHEIVRYLVDEAAIQVNCLDGNDGVTTLNVHVAPSDTGKLIGKQGRTARSSLEAWFSKPLGSERWSRQRQDNSVIDNTFALLTNTFAQTCLLDQTSPCSHAADHTLSVVIGSR